MIITRTPLRISLGGGGTDLPSYSDVYGGMVISAAINRYMFISLNKSFGDDYQLKYSRLERAKTIDEIEHPIIREALTRHYLPPGIEIVSVADIPAGTGLGTSGSFTVGLLRALTTWRRDFATPDSLAYEACDIEIEGLGRPVGKQDQYIAAFGGLAVMDFHVGGGVSVLPLRISSETLAELESNLVMFFIILATALTLHRHGITQINTSGDAVLALQPLAGRFAVELAALVEMDLGQRARCFGGLDAEAAASVVEVKEDAAILLGDGGEGARNQLGAIAGDRAEDVAGEAMGMDADQRGSRPVQVAAHQGDVLIVIHIARIGDDAEIAVARGKNGFCYAAHVTLVLHAVADQVRDREHFQVVLVAKFVELRDARHGPVFVHDFADDGGRIEPGDARKINACFGLTGSDKHPAVARPQRKDVAGPRQILRPRLRINGGKNSDRPVGGADAGGDAQASIDSFREGRAVHRSVNRRHER